jgi:hypothetical protein
MGNKKGSYRKQVDPVQVMALAMRGSSHVRIAKHFEISVDTLTRRFSKELDIGYARGEIAIDAAVYDEAVNKKNTVLLKHLSIVRNKNLETTKVENTGHTTQEISMKLSEEKVQHLSREELRTLNALLEKIE